MASSVIKTKPRFILVSDLDWTMVDHNDKQNKQLLAFNKLWAESFASDSILVFSTGRSHALYSQLKKEVPLMEPDVLICSVGTEIFYEASSEAEPTPDQKWMKLLDQGWNRDEDSSEQRPHKVSYHVTVKGTAAESVVKQLEHELQKEGISAKIIYSGGEDLDVLPQQASKGKGLEFLLQEVERSVGGPTDGVLVNGDSGNDIELFQVPNVHGTMVSNAHPELQAWVNANPSPNIFQASERCAGGILEALHHFNFLKS